MASAPRGRTRAKQTAAVTRLIELQCPLPCKRLIAQEVGHGRDRGGLRGMSTVFNSPRQGRAGVVLALGLVGSCFLAARAHAGVYTVTGCDETQRVDGWTAAFSPGYGTAYGAGCPGNP